MRTVIQRVTQARVTVEGKTVGEIARGMVALIGIAEGDTEDDLALMADKLVNLRIFEDDHHHMNRSLLDIGGAMLAISQFTLLANCRKGRRPSFTGAAAPEVAGAMCDCFVEMVRASGVQVETGVFGAMMQVELTNAGPVTITLDSDELRAPRRQAE